jgi:hypothetical protein
VFQGRGAKAAGHGGYMGFPSVIVEPTKPVRRAAVFTIRTQVLRRALRR